MVFLLSCHLALLMNYQTFMERLDIHEIGFYRNPIDRVFQRRVNERRIERLRRGIITGTLPF